MIQFIDEINRLLWACGEMGPDGAELDSVLQLCSSLVLRARFPNHLETVEFCQKTGLVQVNGGRIKLTTLGEVLWGANPEGRYELTEKQKEIFIANCLLTEEFRSSLQGVFAQFVPDYSANMLTRSKIDDPPLSGEPSLLESLKDLGLIVETQTSLAVGTNHAKSVLAFASGQLSLSDLKQILALQEKIGEFAENIVLSFELNRLQSIGCSTEAGLVQRISELDTTAGFDLISFDGRSTDLVHNRFVEVKGSTRNKLNFFFTKNELETAKKLGKKYWIYFVGGIDLATAYANGPLTLQDPYELISTGRLKAECVLYHITD
jgi:hypothetical protein